MNTQSYKTPSANAATVEKKWLIIDAEGLVLGRMATKVASLLRGKHKPSFTPHVDCGDNVIVINADKIRLTGNKWNAKEYVRFTGYPGGKRTVVAKDVLKRFPERMVETAIRGMLPKTRLGSQMYRNLRVYAGAEHKHEAQNPEKIN